MDNGQQILEKCHADFRATESARILILYRSRDNRLSFDERLFITKEIEKVFYPVFLELRSINPSLTDLDLLLSVLSHEGFSVAVIAECFCVSADAVRMRKSRLREKLPEEWFSLLFHTVTKTYQSQCHDSVTEISSGDDAGSIPLAAETLNEKIMEKNSLVEMTFGQAILKGIGETVRFRGRASRSEFWYYTLFCLILQTILFILYVLVRNMLPMQHNDSIETKIWVVFVAAISVSHCAVSVRRFHDTEHSGWQWALTYLLPYLTLATILIWKNEYAIHLQWANPSVPGPDPFVMSWANALYIINLVILIATSILAIVQYCKPGTEGPNYYGPDPLFKDKDNKVQYVTDDCDTACKSDR